MCLPTFVFTAVKAHFYFLTKICESLKQLEQGLLVDLGTEGRVWLTATVVVALADMPEANALCNVLGPKANHYCRHCTISRHEVGTPNDSFLALQKNARVDADHRRAIDGINRLGNTARHAL